MNPIPPASESSCVSDNRTPSPSQPDGSTRITNSPDPTYISHSTKTAQSPSLPQTPPPTFHRTIHIHICDIEKPDPLNGRLQLNEDTICELTHLIARDGLLTPLLVRPNGHRYELIAGNHRLAAMRRLNWKTAPAVILKTNEYETARLRMIENTARTNLTPVEEAKQLSKLVQQHPDGVDGVAADIHRRPEWILDRLEIADYPESLLQHIHTRRISLAAARYLARIPDPDLREHHIRYAANDGCTARMARQWLHSTEAEESPIPPPPENSSISAIPAYISQTKALCLLCQTYNDLDQTRRETLCVNCLSAIQAQRAQTTEPTTPERTPLQAIDTNPSDSNPTDSGTDAE